MTPSTLVWKAFDQAPATIAVLRGPDHVYEYVNQAYLRIVGLRNPIGLPVREALPELEGQGFFELLDGVRATGEPFVGEGLSVWLQREPGAALEERSVDFVYQPLLGPDGAVEGILAQGVDVTERVLAHRALSEREERYRSLFVSIDQGYCLCEIVQEDGRAADYRFLEVNPAFAEMTGITSDAAGRTARELVPGLEDHWVETYARVGLGRESVRFEQGSEAMGRSFSVFASPVGTPESGRFAIVFTDVSEWKRAALLNTSLEGDVAERTTEVHVLAARLTVAEQEERDRIAQVLHDDLQQRLFGASFALVLLQRSSLDEATEMLAARAASIIDEAVTLSRTLVTDLSPSILHATRLRNLFAWVASETQRKYGLTVDVEVRGDPVLLAPAPRILLYKSVCEVLFNVVKHAGVERARLTAWEDRDHVVVVVEDDGAGFDMGAPTSGRPSGLGLPGVCERLVLLGGRFEIDSAPGRGTRVTLAVPAAELVPALP